MTTAITCERCLQPLPQAHGVTIQEAGGWITAGGRSARLTRAQFALFMVLYRRFGRVVPKDVIYDQLFQLRNDQDQPDIKIIDVYACAIRKRLRDSRIPLALLTEWGVGYRVDHMALAAPESAPA